MVEVKEDGRFISFDVFLLILMVLLSFIDVASSELVEHGSKYGTYFVYLRNVVGI